MQLNLLGQTSQDTVWSGVLGLYESGMQGIAVVVFLCSMAVPLLKLLLPPLRLLMQNKSRKRKKKIPVANLWSLWVVPVVKSRLLNNPVRALWYPSVL